MSTEVLMPALSPTMEKGNLTKWLKKEGDTVKSGDVLAEIETDKATMEVEAVDEGVLARILVDAGTNDVAVNTPIAVIGGKGEKIDLSAVNNNIKQSSKQKQVGDTVAGQQKQAESAVPPAPKFIPIEMGVPEGTEYLKLTVREALRDAMAEEMRRDKNVYVIGEEVAEYQGAYKITQGLLQEFGEQRVVDTPISEYGFMGVAAGSALVGLRPIVEFMTFNFSMQAIDHIITAAKTLYMSGGQIKNPIVVRGPNGPAARVAAQHSQDYSSWYSHVPGLKVIAPYSAADAKGLLKSAIRDDNPVVFLENEILYGQSFDVPKLDDYTVPIGKARVHKEGSDVTIVAWSIGMVYALKAEAELSSEGIDVEIIDLRTLRPLDSETVVASIQKTNRCVVIEEGWQQNGIGAEISARIMESAFDYLDAPVARVSGKDVPMPYAANLEKLALPNVAELVAAVKQVMYRD
jgi:pyruvate dehydrogenase E1 component beta subunit